MHPHISMSPYPHDVRCGCPICPDCLLRNLRVGGGGGWGAGGGAGGGHESELYRVWDVGACTYFTSQTQGVLSGHLIFVRQGKHGALSLVIVGGRAEDAADDEFTILVRGC